MITNKSKLSVAKQCDLLSVSRSTFYYQPVITPDDLEELKLIRLIDELHLEYPFAGSRRIRDHLMDFHGIHVNRKRVQRLMRLMGISSIYPKPRLSKPGKGHKIYPYLLRDLRIERPNQVWAMDITYIPMAVGHCYFTAIMDLYSRRILSYRLSNSLDTAFCIEAVEEAIDYFGCPEIFNTDQGSQFTSDDFTGILEKNEIQISMDGKGRWIELYPAYPNPFNPVTTIKYSIPEDGLVRVTVHDLKGRLVAELVNGQMHTGTHEISWNASGQSSGIYLVNLKSGAVSKHQKIIVLK